MGMAELIQAKFIGEELCVSMGLDAETITYEQSWTSNREFFRGRVRSVDHGILELEIPGQGTIWINCEEISSVWQRPFDYYSALRVTVTNKPAGGRKAGS